jgi:hypothetical protein
MSKQTWLYLKLKNKEGTEYGVAPNHTTKHIPKHIATRIPMEASGHAFVLTMGD